MASRKLDYVVEKLEEQNRKDEKQLLKENHISKRFVDVLNKNRENSFYVHYLSIIVKKLV